MDDALFSLRTDEDYGVGSGVSLTETRWQRMLAALGVSLEQWKTNSVTAKGKETYPYPGTPEKSTVVSVSDSPFTDAGAGTDKPRGDGSAYSDAAREGIQTDDKTFTEYPVLSGLAK
jgi:hypothetical protein